MMRRAIGIGLTALVTACAPATQGISRAQREAGERDVGEHRISDTYQFVKADSIGSEFRPQFQQLETRFDFFADGYCDSWKVKRNGKEDIIMLYDSRSNDAIGELARVPAGAKEMRVRNGNSEVVLALDYAPKPYVLLFRNSKPLEFEPEKCE